jgi:membrane protein
MLIQSLYLCQAKMFKQELMLKRIIKFIREEIWVVELTSYPKFASFFIRQLRIIILAAKGFRKNRINLHASALTFYSMLSVVPVVALAFGISKGFGFEEKLEKLIHDFFAGREDLKAAADYLIEFANNMLVRINGGFIAGIGLVVLLWSVMQLLGNIEDSFNAIWEIKKARPFIRKFSDYTSMMLILPVLFLLSTSATFYLSNFVNGSTGFLQYLGPAVAFLIKLVPYLIIYLLFTLLYVVMPNTKVIFKYGLLAAFITGTIYQIIQWIYFEIQVGVSRYGAIYGSFLLIPFFLVWMQLSWLIVLLGAELSFAYQNIEKYEVELEALNIPPEKKRQVTFLILHEIIKGFMDGMPAPSATKISHKLGIPIRLVRDILFELNESGLIAETTTDSPRERAFLPAIDINQMTISFVQNKLDMHGQDLSLASDNENLKNIMAVRSELFRTMEKSPSNKLLKDL